MSFAPIICMILFSSCLLPYAISVSKEDPFVRVLPYPDSHVTEVEGVMVHYRLGVAEASRGKILLIHGLGGSTSSFDTVIGPLVDAGYLVVAVDLPGFGYSGRPEGFDHSQMHRAALVWQLLDELERTAGTDPWIILGHSMGGGTAVAMACQRPGSTRSVVLVAGALEDRGSLSAAVLRFPPYARWLSIFLERSLITKKRFSAILAKAYGRDPTEDEVASYLQPLRAGGTARSLVAMVRTSRSLPLGQLGSLSMQVDAIWGSEDTFVPLRSVRAITEELQHLRLHIIEGAGHLPMESHPEDFVRILLGLLSSAER